MERRSRSKILYFLIWIKEPCVQKFEGLARSKILGVSQTEIVLLWQHNRAQTGVIYFEAKVLNYNLFRFVGKPVRYVKVDANNTNKFSCPVNFRSDKICPIIRTNLLVPECSHQRMLTAVHIGRHIPQKVIVDFQRYADGSGS